jgi:hypothetical protein
MSAGSSGSNFVGFGSEPVYVHLVCVDRSLFLAHLAFRPCELLLSLFVRRLYTILKGNHPGTIPARFGLIWFSGFRGEDSNVIFYQNMPNLHNRYISAERKISQQKPGINAKLPLAK